MTAVPGTPQALLSSRDWRLRNSAWLLPQILCCGFGTFAGFAYIGIKARTRKWVMAAIVYGVAAIVAYTFIAIFGSPEEGEPGTPVQSVSTWILMAVWVAGMVHSALSQREWLRKKAVIDCEKPWYDEALTPSGGGLSYQSPIETNPFAATRAPSATMPAQPAGAPEADWTPPPPPPIGNPTITRRQSEHYGPPAVSPAPAAGQIDLNTASAVELVATLGLDPALASQVVDARTRNGRYSHPEELMTVAGVQPHIYQSIAGRVTCSPTSAGPLRPPSRGRRLDL